MKQPQLFYTPNASLQKVIEDAFSQIDDGEGFEYIIGKINGGDLKIVFEPNCSHELTVIDGVNGFGFTLVSETETKI